jgi:hypothetical protein
MNKTDPMSRVHSLRLKANMRTPTEGIVNWVLGISSLGEKKCH